MDKIVIFGIDGGSLKLIEGWKDELPNFKRIMENGVYGELESTIPPLTCPAWPCMFTGKNPGEIGMYGFSGLQFSDHYGSRIYSSLDYKSSSLWKRLNDYGKGVGLLNVAMTFPPHKISSFMVCGVGSPLTSEADYTSPLELRHTLDKVVGGYEILPPILLTIQGKEEEIARAFDRVLTKRVKAARYLMHNFPWDLFVCVFFASDSIQHYFWHHMDASHPRHDSNNKYKNVIKDFYKRIDNAIGTLMAELPKDINLLIVSDHGFGPMTGYFMVNKWLENTGFLKFKGRVHQGRINSVLRQVRDFLMSHLSLKLVRLIARVTPEWLAMRLSVRQEQKDKMIQTYESIDWSQTKAYGMGVMSQIFINLKGREPSGIVEPGEEYEKVRGDIIAGLEKVTDPQTGAPIGFKIFRKEEVYHGKYVDLAPDILIVPDKYHPSSFKADSEWSIPALSGGHVRQGLFMAYGPDIKNSGKKLLNLKIYDIFPTILHMFELPIPTDIDGRVLTEIIKEGSEPAYREPRHQGIAIERGRIRDRIRRLKK